MHTQNIAEPDLKTRVADIHHDKANKPWTTVTVLMYLEDTELGWRDRLSVQLKSHLCSMSKIVRRKLDG